MASSDSGRAERGKQMTQQEAATVKVYRELSKQELQILQHALGVDEFGREQVYRNYFAAGPDDIPTCQALIEMGYMRQVATTVMFPDFNCRVTEEGKAAVLRKSPKLPKGEVSYPSKFSTTSLGQS